MLRCEEGGAVEDSREERECLSNRRFSLSPYLDVLVGDPESDGLLPALSDLEVFAGLVEADVPSSRWEFLILDRVEFSRPVWFEVCVDLSSEGLYSGSLFVNGCVEGFVGRN